MYTVNTAALNVQNHTSVSPLVLHLSTFLRFLKRHLQKLTDAVSTESPGRFNFPLFSPPASLAFENEFGSGSLPWFAPQTGL